MDTIDLESILTNLYLNSIQSLAKTSGKKRTINFEYLYKDKTLTIKLSDNGRGIPPKKLKEIFEQTGLQFMEFIPLHSTHCPRNRKYFFGESLPSTINRLKTAVTN